MLITDYLPRYFRTDAVGVRRMTAAARVKVCEGRRSGPGRRVRPLRRRSCDNHPSGYFPQGAGIKCFGAFRLPEVWFICGPGSNESSDTRWMRTMEPSLWAARRPPALFSQGLINDVLEAGLLAFLKDETGSYSSRRDADLQDCYSTGLTIATSRVCVCVLVWVVCSFCKRKSSTLNRRASLEPRFRTLP